MLMMHRTYCRNLELLSVVKFNNICCLVSQTIIFLSTFWKGKIVISNQGCHPSGFHPDSPDLAGTVQMSR